jgi:hypothetical protein
VHGDPLTLAANHFSHVAKLEHRVRELERQLAYEKRLTREVAALHMFERFHAFDAIKDDSCPACGGRVRVIEDYNSVRLEAVPG